MADDGDIDFAEALGIAKAALHLNQTIMTKLLFRGVLSVSDCKDIVEIAEQTISYEEGTPDDVKTIALFALRGSRTIWEKPAQNN